MTLVPIQPQVLPSAAVAAPAVAGGPPDAADATCREFEAVLCSAMLKEALKSSATSVGDSDEADSGGGTFMEFAWEQMAYHVGQQGVLGLSQTLGTRLRESLEAPRR